MRIFEEEQKFIQLWLHILLILSFISGVVLITREWILSTNDDTNVKIGFFVALGSMILVYGLIYSFELKTRIDEKGIHYRFIPFHLSIKFIAWDELNNAYVRKYDPISEFGGWGIKGRVLKRKSKGVAFNIKGNIGLQLELQNGKKILIGTQKEEEVKRVLITYADKIINQEN
jgi:hypothetical protein